VAAGGRGGGGGWYAGGGGWYTGAAAGAETAGDGAAAGTAPAFAPQFPQNFISGIMGFPHDWQTVPACCAAAAGGTAMTGAGGGTGTGAAGRVGTPAGGGIPACRVPAFVPQTPQNFSSGASGAPQARQLMVCAGAEGTGAGGAAAGGIWAGGTIPGGIAAGVTGAEGGAAGSSSMSDAPQFRQNFCTGPTLLPHSGQNGMGRSHKRICTRSLMSIALHKTGTG